MVVAALTATMVTLVAYMMMNGDDSNGDWAMSSWDVTVTRDGANLNQVWEIDAAGNRMKVTSINGDSLFVVETDGSTKTSYSLMNPDMDLSYLPDEDADFAALLKEEQTTIPQMCESVADDSGSGDGDMRGFVVDFDDAGNPASISDDAGVYATINSMKTIDGFELVGCDGRRHLSEAFEQRKLDILDKRNLHSWNGFSGAATNSNYCGPGTDVSTLGCPINKQDAACRKHDFCAFYIPGTIPKLSCECDYDIQATADNAVVSGVYGAWGIAGAIGCATSESTRHCHWAHCGWRGCRWTCGAWSTNDVIKYGPNRYGSRHAYGYDAPTNDQCPSTSPCEPLWTGGWTGCCASSTGTGFGDRWTGC